MISVKPPRSSSSSTTTRLVKASIRHAHLASEYQKDTGHLPAPPPAGGSATLHMVAEDALIT